MLGTHEGHSDRLDQLDALEKAIAEGWSRVRSVFGFVLFLWVPIVLFGLLRFEGQAETALLAVTLGGAGIHALFPLIQVRALTRRRAALLDGRVESRRLDSTKG